MKSDEDDFFVIKHTPFINNTLLGNAKLFNPNIDNSDVYRRLAIRVYLCD